MGVGGLTYQYDAENNRVAKTHGIGTTSYVIDPHGDALPRVLIREKPDGSLTYYVYGIGLLYEVDEIDATVTYHFDQSGSTIALSNDSGEITDRMEYSPFGAITYRMGTTDTPYLYAGQFGIEQETNGLLYMRARYYSPELQRFINSDPIRFDGGLNWYAYANNSPLMYVDPDGELAIIGAIIGGFADLFGQLVIERRTLSEVNIISIVGSAALGATGAGLSQVVAKNIARTSFSAAGKLGARTLANAGIGGGLSAVNTGIRNQFRSEADQQSVLGSAALGFTFSGLGSLTGEGVTSVFSALTKTRATGLAKSLILSGQLELSNSSSFPTIGQVVGTAASSLVSSGSNFFHSPVSAQSYGFNGFEFGGNWGNSNSFTGNSFK
ncbi:MAG: RHS repeat-associated core domain-containing protein [Verrucomicrobiota bacterium]